MTRDTDEKYAKARRQNVQSKAVIVIAVFLACIAVGLITHATLKRGHSPVRLKLPPVKKSHVKDPPAKAQPVKEQPVKKDTVVEKPPKDDTPALTTALIRKVEELDAEVRRIKETGVIMEADDKSLAATKNLQDATRELLAARYGVQEPYRVKLILQFQESIPDFDEKGPDGSILLEMAPSRLQPHSIFTFMEIARQYKGGAFHRIAGHVLQVMVHGGFKHLAFQEYSPEYPHKERTVGYAGRPSGPGWYVSIEDNTKNHGPGSQQKHNPYEADSCFGKVIEGYDDEVQRISKIPEKGFLDDPKKFVKITEMHIMVPGSGPNAVDGYVEWQETPVKDT